MSLCGMVAPASSGPGRLARPGMLVLALSVGSVQAPATAWGAKPVAAPAAGLAQGMGCRPGSFPTPLGDEEGYPVLGAEPTKGSGAGGAGHTSRTWASLVQVYRHAHPFDEDAALAFSLFMTSDKRLPHVARDKHQSMMMDFTVMCGAPSTLLGVKRPSSDTHKLATQSIPSPFNSFSKLALAPAAAMASRL
jgi:hypothetical protein